MQLGLRLSKISGITVRDSIERRRTHSAGTPSFLAAALSFLAAALSFLTAALLVGCASPDGTRSGETSRIPDPIEVIPTGPDAIYSSDGLVLVSAPQIPSSSRLYVKPPRPHLQRYKTMVLAATSLSYREGTLGWSRRRENEILGSFESDLLEQLEAGEFWERSDRIGEDTLILKATVAELDLVFDRPDSGSGSATSFVQPGGGAILGFEIFDASTREPLMRFISRGQLPGGIYGGSDIDEQRLRVLFRRFAQELGKMLQAHYGAVREIEQREAREAEPSPG